MKDLSPRVPNVWLSLLLVLGVSSWGGLGSEPVSSDTSTTEDGAIADDVVSTTGLPDAEWSKVELAVLDAIDDDPHPKQARYEVEADRIVVTVHLLGDEIPAEHLRDLEMRAEEVTDGIDVVVTTTDADVPTED